MAGQLTDEELAEVDKAFLLFYKEMASGFSVDLELIEEYNMFNKDRKELYLTCKYSSDYKNLMLDQKGPMKKKTEKSYAEKNKHWEELISKLPEDEIRFIPIQVEYRDVKGKNQNDVLIILWSPDGVNMMKKLEVDSHKPVVMRCLPGARECIEIKSKTDWNLEKIVKDKLEGSLD